MKIKSLSQDVVMKIAAGEVVTGAFAAVKELIENSIDAGADAIKVEITEGGKSYIKVEDNGFGMTLDEIKMAVLPHTTSKINSIDDLYTLNSFGFRGEALSSICQISKLKITSKTQNDELANQIEHLGGKEISCKKIPSKVGTTIEVLDLFYNVPARRKFLKTPSTEGRYVTEIVEKFILNFESNFTYIKDGKTIYNILKSDSLEQKILKLYPELKSENLIKIDDFENDIRISGYISKPDTTRINRTAQNFFINKRYVKSGLLFSILNKAYGEMLEKSKHPYSFINIDINPEAIDVNVHPQKLEVNFSDSSKVMNFIRTSFRTALKEKTNYSISFENITEEKKIQNYEKETEHSSHNHEDFSYSPPKYFKENFQKTENSNSDNFIKKENNFLNEKRMNFDISEIKEKKIFEQDTQKENSNIRNYRILGIVKTRYIVVEYEERITFIDFHAAHERVLYEKLKKHFVEQNGIVSNALLFEKKLDLDFESIEIIKEKNDLIKKLGIIIKVENNEAILTSVPLNLDFKKPEILIREIVEELKLEGIENPEKIFDKAISTIACRAAVKTGDDFAGIETLINNIHSMNLQTCPHGRPISMEIKFDKLDKFFERT